MPTAERRMSFKPVNYDATNIPPDAPAGEWTAKAKCKVDSSGDPVYAPRVIIEWKITAAANEDQESWIGQTVTDFLTFWPEGHQFSKMSKQTLQSLSELVEFDLADFPKRIESDEDLDEFVAAIEADAQTIWTVVKDKDGVKRTNVRYRGPKGAIAMPIDLEEDESPAKTALATPEEEDEQDAPPPPAAPKNGTNGKVKKKHGR